MFLILLCLTLCNITMIQLFFLILINESDLSQNAMYIIYRLYFVNYKMDYINVSNIPREVVVRLKCPDTFGFPQMNMNIIVMPALIKF